MWGIKSKGKAADDKLSEKRVFKIFAKTYDLKTGFSGPTWRQYTFSQIVLQISH
jgi:hypothetical protein